MTTLCHTPVKKSLFCQGIGLKHVATKDYKAGFLADSPFFSFPVNCIDIQYVGSFRTVRLIWIPNINHGAEEMRKILITSASIAIMFVLVPGTAAQCQLGAERIAGGLSRPVAVAYPNDVSNRLFIIEKHTGLIRILFAG